MTAADPALDIRSAERREAEARQRLTASLQLLQARLTPKALARNARLRITDAASNGADAARQNPLPVIGAGVAAGLFLARHRIARLFRRKKKLTVPAQARSHPSSPPEDHSHD
ncbi:MAG: hypothetical protein JO157_18810 [Acetobacteraceae bacterium]|nr:hypothetical protein [Acetobacteraceae bacterium]